MPSLPQSNPKGMRAFQRVLTLDGDTNDARPETTAGETPGEFRVSELHSITIAFRLAILASVNMQLYGALRSGGEWFKINNGTFDAVQEFCEDIACAGLTHIFVSFSDVVGAGEEEITVLANGVRRSEG